MASAAYNILGKLNEEGNQFDTERVKEKSKLSYDEKPPNNDIRMLTRPK